MLVDCLLFGLSAASNKSNGVCCPESPPNVRRSPTQVCRALFIWSRLGAPTRQELGWLCHRAAGACQGAAHVRDEGSRRRAAYLKV